MRVNYIKMTGPELKKIYVTSGMNGAEFAKRLGISRAGLYLMFKDKLVGDEIEYRLTHDPELGKFRQMMSTGGENQISRPTETLYREVMEMARNTMSLFQQSLTLHEKEFESTEKDLETFRALINQGIRTGAISYKQQIGSKKH